MNRILLSLLPHPHRNADEKDQIFPVMAAAKLCFPRPLDSLRRKLKKPLFKGDAGGARERLRRGGAGWRWKSALLFWKQSHDGGGQSGGRWRSRTAQLWPVYTTESSSGGGARWPRAAMLLASAEVGAAAAGGVAYRRLRDAGGDHRAAAPPVYIVT